MELATQRKAHSILAYSRLSLAEILVLQNKLDQAEEILADYLTQGDALGGLFQAKVLLQYCKLLVVRGRDHEGNEVLEHCLECFLAECDTPRQFWLIDEAIAQVNETGGVHGSNL